MKSKYNRQNIGKWLRHFRYEKGLTTITFADELDVPALLIELLEQNGAGTYNGLSAMIPEKEIDNLLHSIQVMYDMGEEPLRKAIEAAGKETLPCRTDEVTLQIPLTMSVDQAMAMVDQICLLSMEEKRNRENRERILGNGIASAVLLVQLLSAQYKQTGRDEEGEQCINRFSHMLHERLNHLDDV